MSHLFSIFLLISEKPNEVSKYFLKIMYRIPVPALNHWNCSGPWLNSLFYAWLPIKSYCGKSKIENMWDNYSSCLHAYKTITTYHQYSSAEAIQGRKLFVKIRYSQVPKKEYTRLSIPNKKVGLLFWANFLGLNKQVGWKIS